MKRFIMMSLAAALVLAFAATAMAGATYDRVMKEKVVRAGLMTDSIPGGFYNAKKEWVGFDVDMAKEVAKRIGCKLEMVAVNNKTRISFLQTGRVDMSFSNMTHKRERDKSIDFSITYFFDGQKMLAPKGKFSSLKDFAGKRIAVQQGTTSEINVKKLLLSLGDKAPKVITFQKEPECFQALQMGRVDAWSTDSTILLGYAAQVPGKYELVGDFFSNEPYGVGLPQDDSAWRDLVNFTIQDIWKDGTYKKIYDKWYGPDTKYYFPLTEKIEMWP